MAADARLDRRDGRRLGVEGVEVGVAEGFGLALAGLVVVVVGRFAVVVRGDAHVGGHGFGHAGCGVGLGLGLGFALGGGSSIAVRCHDGKQRDGRVAVRAC